jgi:hypothetical protein
MAMPRPLSTGSVEGGMTMNNFVWYKFPLYVLGEGIRGEALTFRE